MSDIVERVNRVHDKCETCSKPTCACAMALIMAAEVERLREALRDISTTFGDGAGEHARSRARAALTDTRARAEQR